MKKDSASRLYKILKDLSGICTLLLQYQNEKVVQVKQGK